MQRESSDAELSQELVTRIQAGDGEAWERLYRRYHDPLLLAIRARLGSGLRAWLQSEDVLSSVVRDALVDLQGFEHRGKGSLEHYLHVCVLNKIRSKAAFYGAAKRTGEERVEPTELDRFACAEAGPTYFDADGFGRLEKAMTSLPEEQREVILLRAVEKLPNEEVARIMGKTPAATSKLFNRTLARLGSQVGSLQDGGR
jgi:RNA polymerase sigma-70 factor (ECF subfamily)